MVTDQAPPAAVDDVAGDTAAAGGYAWRCPRCGLCLICTPHKHRGAGNA